ncbi:gap junction beta-2 protein-like [Pleurodeles waltl]
MALVSGLFPVLRTVIETTTDYNGRTLWFGFMGIRLITVYIAEIPWSKLDTDFQCDVNTSDFCRKACYNAHFHIPVVSLWNFTYIPFIISVFLMELFASQLRHNLIKAKKKEGMKNKTLQHSDPTGQDMAQKVFMIDFHHQKKLLGLYLSCIILRLVLEIGFLYVLLRHHLPNVDGSPINCSTGLCSGPYTCMVRGAAEKRMSIFMLCTVSGAIIGTSVIFALYCICHYLLLRRRQPGRPM